MPHLVTNDEQIARILRGDAIERHKQQLIDYIQREMEHVVFTENDAIDPSNAERQMGRPLTSQEMERRLRPVLPSNIAFIDHPYNPDIRAVVRSKNINEYETICPYHRGVQPEHSIMQVKEIEIPDVDVLARRKSISGRDMPKSEYVPGVGFVFDPTVTRPGYVRVKQLGHEVRRGWRSVLIKLIMQGLLTITDAERLFGTDNNAAWQQHVKGVNNDIPW